MGPDELSTLPAETPAERAATERYVLRERLGEGGMGAVWAARDVALDRDVAFKVLHDRFLGGAHQERLAAEARAMARLSHPNVVAVYDVGQRDGRMYLTMELVRGASLSRWLETPRTWQAIVEMFRGAAAGLTAAHAAGIVHRDVKPTNILVGDDGRPRVADFGVAHAAAAPPENGQLVTADTTGMIGSPAYMAPEQLSGQPSDERTDQFGLCVSLYEALHGRRPFEEATIGAQIMAITRGAPEPVREVPAWLHAAIARGLAAHPDARFPSMAALGAALAGPRSRRAVTLGVAAGVVLLAGAGLVYAVTRSPAETVVVDGAVAIAPTDAASAKEAAPAPTPIAPTTPEDKTQLYRSKLAAGIRAFRAKDYASAAASFEQAIPIADDPNALVWATNTACAQHDEKRARGYLGRIPKDLDTDRAAILAAVELCVQADVDLRDLARAIAPQPVAKRSPPPPPPPPAPKLSPEEARKKYREVLLAAQAASKDGDYAAARKLDLEALAFNVDHDPDARAGAAVASCHLDDRNAAIEHLKAIVRTTNLGLNSRHTVVSLCGRLGIDLLDVLDPEERNGFR